MLDHIAMMHQQVREYVEHEEPEYKVTSIVGDAETDYAPSLASRRESSPEYILVRNRIRFRVSAMHVELSYKTLSCEVRVTEEGKLCMMDSHVKVSYKTLYRKSDPF